MTCIIAGKCKDGVALVADRKITYDDHPLSYVGGKLDSSFYPIVTGGAGSYDLFNQFKSEALTTIQPQHRQENVPISGEVRIGIKPDRENPTTQPNVQTSCVVRMYTGPTSPGYTFGLIQSKFANLVRSISTSKKAIDLNGTLEILTATQLSDVQEAKLTHVTHKASSDVPDYRSIGTSSYYAYVFLKPLYDIEPNITMHRFVRAGYFIIKYLSKFELDTDVGGQPQFWCIPNTGALFTDVDRHQWNKQFDVYTNKVLEDFQKHVIKKLVLPEKDD
jgi:hypothetical protein